MTYKENQAKLRAIRNTQDIMSNYTITLVMADSKDQCSEVYYKNRPTTVSKQLAWHFENTRCKWDIVCGVLNRDQKGKHIIEFVSFGSKQECSSNDLYDLTVQICQEMFEKANKLTKLCPFYMARPQKEVDLLLILDTIHTYKIFNLIGTNFELDCNVPFTDYHKDWLKVLQTVEFKQWDLEFIDEI